MIYTRGLVKRLCVPNVTSIKKQIFEMLHSSQTGGHHGFHKTLELVIRQFYWRDMKSDVLLYVRSCVHCQKAKDSTSKPIGVMYPMPIPSRPWETVTMDFMTNLPECDDKNMILVVVDKFTKFTHMIPARMNDTAAETASLFFKEIVALHGMPKCIISDRDAKFTSEFWTSLFKCMNTTLHFSTPYHPQTDGQSERAIRTINNMLRTYMSQFERDWVELLPSVQIAYNNAQNATTRYSPFYMNYGYHPTLPQTHVNPQSLVNNDVTNYVTQVQRVHEFVKNFMMKAQKSQKFYYDKKRRDIRFQVGDRVLVDATRFHGHGLKLPKLHARYMGPYVIERRISHVAFRLRLPPAFHNIHPVFHVSSLKPLHESRFHQQVRPVRERVHDEHRVIARPHVRRGIEFVLAKKVIRGKIHYLVSFVDSDSSENAWMRPEDIPHARDKISLFERTLKQPYQYMNSQSSFRQRGSSEDRSHFRWGGMQGSPDPSIVSDEEVVVDL